jgi:polyisoprenoid-binding protein YceI
MSVRLFSDDGLRAMYAGHRAGTTARRLARMWAVIFALGLFPRRWVTLEVAGRRSGLVTRFPLGMADCDGQWYLVSMLGERCNWVRNVRAAEGRATLRHRRAMACRLTEVPVSERPPIIKRYLQRVPCARPHLPVDRSAPVSDFAAIAARYPVFRVAPAGPPTRRRRHWLRWVLGGVAALAVLVVLAATLFVKLQPVPAPLALPKSPPSVPAGPLDGSWLGGGVAGFRIRETAFGVSNDVVGRTSAVSGSLVISGGRITAGSFRAGLTAMTVGGKPQPQFATSMDTAQHPAATFTLARPVTLNSGFTSGATLTAGVTGRLALHGVSRMVTITVSGRRDGHALLLAGSFPVTFADWGIAGPQGYGFIASLADRGVAEFLLVLNRR